MIPNNGGAGIEGVSSESSGGGGGAGRGTLKKGPWSAGEDAILIEYVRKQGEGNWNAVQKNSGLSRCGKSCRLRWANHLRPNLKKGSFSPDEERLILELHSKLGNKWARMAAQLPGRTDNEIKNYWNTRVKRRQRAGLPLYPQDIQNQAHAYANQSSLSPSPAPQPRFSSPNQPPKPTYTSSLSLFEPITLSSTNPHLTHHHHHHHHHNPTFLNPPTQRFKRFHDTSVGFPVTFSATPLPSSLMDQSLSTQLSHVIFDPIFRNQFEPNGLVPPGSCYPAKPELPSSQLSQTGPHDSKINPHMGRSNSGLLDDLLQEAQAMNSRREGLLGLQGEKGGVDGYGPVFSESTPLGSGGQWDDSSSVHSSAGVKTKEEPVDQINSIQEELSNLLDIIPSAVGVPGWFSDSGEISNGQSSGMTDDSIGLEMPQLNSSLPVVTATDHGWTSGSSWNNLPGIC